MMRHAVEKVVRLMGNFVIYTDQVGEYRWYLKADNGRKIADSGEGFGTRQACEDGIRLMKRLAPMAKIDSPRGVETLV